jgi:hypothetical protein
MHPRGSRGSRGARGSGGARRLGLCAWRSQPHRAVTSPRSSRPPQPAHARGPCHPRRSRYHPSAERFRSSSTRARPADANGQPRRRTHGSVFLAPQADRTRASSQSLWTGQRPRDAVRDRELGRRKPINRRDAVQCHADGDCVPRNAAVLRRQPGLRFVCSARLD